jgi:rhamnogalacturonyl hydrolase YesR
MPVSRRWFTRVLPSLSALSILRAAGTEAVGQTAAPDPSAWRRLAGPIGVTRGGGPILAVPASRPPQAGSGPRIVFVLRPMGEREFAAVAADLVAAAGADPTGARTVVPSQPDGASTGGGVAPVGDPTRGHPPQGGFYDHPTHPEPRYLWRWIGMEGPDLVVEVEHGAGETWFVPDADQPGAELPQLRDLAGLLPDARPLPAGDDLVTQLVRQKPCDVGVVPAVRVVTSGGGFVSTLDRALARMRLPPSPARAELDRRAARSAREIAGQLLEVYGRKLDSVQYIPAVALVGRLRQERIDRGQDAAPPPAVLEATAPYLDGGRTTIDAKAGSSGFSGHLVFGELAHVTGDRKYVELVLAAANAAFDADGRPREAMPSHNEMSDAVFMGSPVLAQAARLTGDAKYADACLRNLRFIEKLCLRPDGLYRHSPLDEAAWGRGNGFPALGLCWSLDELPESPVQAEILAAHRRHMAALLPHQDATGCWHQVIDRPESYREFTATAMIAYAALRGVRAGRLDAATFGPPAERAWEALKLRIAADGTLVDVCAGTGKQKSLRDYYDRPAILGRDDRGGAMALMVATERQLSERREGPEPGAR